MDNYSLMSYFQVQLAEYVTKRIEIQVTDKTYKHNTKQMMILCLGNTPKYFPYITFFLLFFYGSFLKEIHHLEAQTIIPYSPLFDIIPKILLIL